MLILSLERGVYMLSFKTSIELIAVIGRYGERVIDRIFTVFEIDHHIHPSFGKLKQDDKLNILIKLLRTPPASGPFTSDFRLDLLQYMVDHYYRHERDPMAYSIVPGDDLDHIDFDDRFSYRYPALANSLKRDGYIMKGEVITKLLPKEIREAETESELFTLLDQFNFATTKGHLNQAIRNHSAGNWAGANSQFRPFIESLLLDISKTILPDHPVDSAGKAINLLSQTASPPFLRSDLNEVESKRCDKPFIEGLWKRLHPEGTHPGLSDEQDSTFRYHITIVVAHYLLKRLETHQ